MFPSNGKWLAWRAAAHKINFPCPSRKVYIAHIGLLDLPIREVFDVAIFVRLNRGTGSGVVFHDHFVIKSGFCYAESQSPTSRKKFNTSELPHSCIMPYFTEGYTIFDVLLSFIYYLMNILMKIYTL